MKPDADTAACRRVDPDMWFPDRSARIQSRAAKRICGSCPLLVPCLSYALDHPAEEGIWGGTGFKERQRIRKARGVAA
jgi:WhiB family redox-sensing transcriptional regulator